MQTKSLSVVQGAKVVDDKSNLLLSGSNILGVWGQSPQRVAAGEARGEIGRHPENTR